MPSSAVLNVAHRIRSAQIDRPDLDLQGIAEIVERELRIADVIAALRRCDTLLEQHGVSVEQRDFVLKTMSILEGASSTAPADAVIGTSP